MFSPRTNRRLLLLALVLVTVLLAGCAEYEVRQPMAERGTVLLTWEISPERTPPGKCGFAQEIAKDHYLITFKRKYDFDNPCWAHELNHAFGGRHQ